jgi:hypothetical protein
MFESDCNGAAEGRVRTRPPGKPAASGKPRVVSLGHTVRLVRGPLTVGLADFFGGYVRVPRFR